MDLRKLFKSITDASSESSEKDSYTRRRRTDNEFAKNKMGMDKRPSEFDYSTGVRLSSAKVSAPNEPGVYVLYLNGEVMKCGRAAYGQGVRWRFTQYYNLKYDSRSQKGDCWSVNKNYRDKVVVSWQCCPAAVCQELEYKLFKKYGKGPWAERGPAYCRTDNWELLI